MDHFLEQTAHTCILLVSAPHSSPLIGHRHHDVSVTRSVTGDDIAICHDSYDGLMIVTLLSRGSDQLEESIRNVNQSEASISSIDQWEASSVSPRVYCNDNWGHIKCDGDFLAHNECIVNITLLKYKYKTDCKTYHFQNSVWCICLATLVTTKTKYFRLRLSW